METASCLRDALKVLPKSSPQAVEVELHDGSHSFLKSYLYIETEIERDFKRKLETLQADQIIFLCGSSGDGKSAILTRYSKEYSDKAVFHLDATHSSAPHQDAITTLDQLFTKMSGIQLPLIIGINIGMMGNYVEGGAEEHNFIKASMRAHLNNKATPPNHIYLDFEHYPKFSFSDSGPISVFAKALFKRLTAKENNPFWDLFEQDKHTHNDPTLTANFSLLSMESVQDVVIDALLKSRLVKALSVTNQEMKEEKSRLREAAALILQQLQQSFPGIKLNGHPQNRLAHNLSLTIPGVEAKALIHCLKKKLSFSTGSACSTIKVEPSHVLKAIGLSDDETFQTIRLGLGRSTDNGLQISDFLIDGIQQMRK